MCMNVNAATIVCLGLSSCSRVDAVAPSDADGSRGAPAASIELVGSTTIAADARDRSRLEGALEDGTPADRFGGFGSAIDWTGDGERYLVLADRGPKDGATSFRCRWHEIEIHVKPDAALDVKLVSTTLLADEQGRAFTGSTAALAADETHAARLDPEGLRLGRDGRVWISDEYGPDVLEFTRDGRCVRRLAVPDAFRCAHPDAKSKKEREHNERGREPNRGLEGLAFVRGPSESEDRLFAVLQSPLIQDGGERATLVRALEFSTRTGGVREFALPLAGPAHGFNELVALAPGRFLALERDSNKGSGQKLRHVVELDLRDAQDVTSRERLDAAVRAAKKRTLLDLASFCAVGALPDKIEGLAFGPDLPDGRRLLVVTSDNDFLDGEPTRFWAFAVPRE